MQDQFFLKFLISQGMRKLSIGCSEALQNLGTNNSSITLVRLSETQKGLIILKLHVQQILRCIYTYKMLFFVI